MSPEEIEYISEDSTDDGLSKVHYGGLRGGLADMWNERMVQKQLDRAVATTGSMPVPPLMKAQIEYVKEVVDSKLDLAVTTSFAQAIPSIFHAKGALQSLLKDLPNLGGYPSDATPDWVDPLITASKALEPLLPKPHYAGKGGRTRIDFTAPPRPPSPPTTSRPSRKISARLMRRKSSQFAELIHNNGVADVAMALGMMGKGVYKKTPTRGAAVQTSTAVEDRYHEEVQNNLRQQTLTAEAKIKTLEKSNTDLQSSLTTAEANLAAKARAVSDLRTSLYKEICLLTEQCHVMRNKSDADVTSVLSIIDESILGLEEPVPSVVGKGHPVHRMIAAEKEIARLKKKQADEKQVWVRESTRNQMRFRTMVSDRKNEDEQNGTDWAEYFYLIQDGAEVVRGEFNVFTNAVMEHIDDFRETLAMFGDEYSKLQRSIQAQAGVMLKSAAFEKLVPAVFRLLTPILDPEYKPKADQAEEEGKPPPHPWSWAAHPDPLGNFMKNEDSGEMYDCVKTEVKQFTKLFEKVRTIVMQEMFSKPADGAEILVGEALREAVGELQKCDYTMRDEDAKLLRAMLEADVRLGKSIARLNFQKLGMRHALNHLITLIETAPTMLVRTIAQMKLRRLERQVVEVTVMLRSLRSERMSNSDMELVTRLRREASAAVDSRKARLGE